VRPACLALPLGLLALTACSEGEARCERALIASLRDPGSYERTSIVEDPRESKAVEGYVIRYSQADAKGRRVRGEVMCDYVPDLKDAEISPL
jgi:hypothetical protein